MMNYQENFPNRKVTRLDWLRSINQEKETKHNWKLIKLMKWIQMIKKEKKETENNIMKSETTLFWYHVDNGAFPGNLNKKEDEALRESFSRFIVW